MWLPFLTLFGGYFSGFFPSFVPTLHRDWSTSGDFHFLVLWDPGVLFGLFKSYEYAFCNFLQTLI